MSIGKRIKFIARSYLNDLFEGDTAEKVGKSVRDLFGGEAQPEDEYGDIDMEELEKRFAAEFADLHRDTAGARRTGKRRPPASGSRNALAAHYKTLELPEGSDYAKVRAQFRSLMRKYHPDRYVSDAKKQAWATKKSQAVSEAFAALEKALQK